MEADRIKWDRRYAGEEFVFSLSPSRFLSENMELIRGLSGRRALDLACGEGRNSIFLAHNGFEVTAIDISERGLERGEKRAAGEGVRVHFVQADLEQYRPTGRYHLVLDFNFLLRPLIPVVVSLLEPGGLMVMETILDAPNLPTGHHREFLLQPGELGRLFAPLAGEILMLEERPQEETPVARIIFRKDGTGGVP